MGPHPLLPAVRVVEAEEEAPAVVKYYLPAEVLLESRGRPPSYGAEPSASAGPYSACPQS